MGGGERKTLGLTKIPTQHINLQSDHNQVLQIQFFPEEQEAPAPHQDPQPLRPALNRQVPRRAGFENQQN